MSSETPQVTLGYWSIRGLCAQIHYQLHYMGVPYERKTYVWGDAPEFSREDWLKEKFELGLDFPNLPYITVKDGDVSHNQSETLPIMRYLAAKFQPELLGTTPEERGRVDQFANVWKDVKMATAMPCFQCSEPKEGLELIHKAVDEQMPPLVKFLGDGTKFVSGTGNVTYIDFALFELCNALKATAYDGRDDLFEKFPTLKTYYATVRHLPKLKEYLESDECLEAKAKFYPGVAKINGELGFKTEEKHVDPACSSGPKIRLGYWAARGLGAQINYQLQFMGLPYEREDYAQGPAPDFSREEWLKVKFNLGLDFPNLPYLFVEDGGVSHNQSETLPIMRYLAAKFQPELLGKTVEEQGRVDQFANVWWDIKKATAMPCYNCEEVQSGIEEIRKAVDEQMPPLVKFLGDGTKFVSGTGNVTYVDFAMFELICAVIGLGYDGKKDDFFEKFPTLKTYYETVRNLPKLKEYLESDNCLEATRKFAGDRAKINATLSF